MTVKVNVAVGSGAGSVGLLLLVLQDCRTQINARETDKRMINKFFLKIARQKILGGNYTTRMDRSTVSLGAI